MSSCCGTTATALTIVAAPAECPPDAVPAATAEATSSASAPIVATHARKRRFETPDRALTGPSLNCEATAKRNERATRRHYLPPGATCKHCSRVLERLRVPIERPAHRSMTGAHS